VRTIAGFLDDDPYTGVAKGMDRSSLPKGAEVNATGVRLANNRLESLDGLAEFLERVLDDPLELRWLDLSNNRLTTVDPVLLNYPKLSCLYLQGNKIAKLSDIDVLAGGAGAEQNHLCRTIRASRERTTACASPPRSQNFARWTSSRSQRRTGRARTPTRTCARSACGGNRCDEKRAMRHDAKRDEALRFVFEGGNLSARARRARRSRSVRVFRQSY
jgi:hypothetical protein